MVKCILCVGQVRLQTLLHYCHNIVCMYVTLSHLRSKESTGIYKPCIPGLFPISRVHLKVDQRVQRNNFPRIHLNVNQCTSECISGKLLFDQSFDLKIELLLEGSVYL